MPDAEMGNHKVRVSDGGYAVYDSISHSIILKDLTGSTTISSLEPFRNEVEVHGYMIHVAEYYQELERLRQETAQIISELLGVPVFAYFRESTRKEAKYRSLAPKILLPQTKTSAFSRSV